MERMAVMIQVCAFRRNRLQKGEKKFWGWILVDSGEGRGATGGLRFGGESSGIQNGIGMTCEKP
jgi:hypothetical protein